MAKQVDKSHYNFKKYITKQRWASMWHQIDEVLAMEPENVLEIGPGPGVFKALLSQFGPKVETLDLDPELQPDHLAPAENMPFRDSSYDVVCAFQMLEHVPYEKSLEIFSEMIRVAKKAVIISLPDAEKRWPAALHIPKFGMRWFHIPRPSLGKRKHVFDGEHYWEVNSTDHPLQRIMHDLGDASNFRLTKTFRVDENPYHRFLIFKL